ARNRALPQTNREQTQSDSKQSWIDPVTLLRIRNLQLRAKTVVEGFYNGLHRSPTHGVSIEFSEYRPYTPGDDLRNLDWKLYARTDRDYIKKFEDETNRRCHLILDQSRSMEYGSLPHTKMRYAGTLAATLAYFLSDQRDSVGIMTFDERIREVVPSRRRHGQLRQILASIEREPSGKSTDLNTPLKEIAALVRRRALVVVISDFLAPAETLRTPLSFLRSRGHEVLCLRVLDPEEVAFDGEEATMVHDLESGRRIYVDPESARDEYQRRFEGHATELQTICHDLGIAWYPMTTDEALEDAIMELIAARQRRDASSSRGSSMRDSHRNVGSEVASSRDSAGSGVVAT
ncbi:MAG: DUF58 domain-containing protein, partial [Planctomycetota bacterium]